MKKLVIVLFAIVMTLGMTSARATINPDVRVDLVMKNGDRNTVAMWNPATKDFTARTATFGDGQQVYRNLYDFVNTLNSRTDLSSNGFANVTVLVEPRTAGVQRVNLNQVESVHLVELD